MKRIPLWLLALLSLVGYLLIRFWFPLDPGYHRSPLPDIRVFAPSLWAGLGYAALLCFLFLLLYLAYQRLRENGPGVSLGLILLMTALFCLPLIFTYPYNATDVYRYFVRGRVTAVHDLSPFSTPPRDLLAPPYNDPYAELAGEWGYASTPYGPVWELLAAGVTSLSRDDLQKALLLFKGLGALTHLGLTCLVWLILREQGVQPRLRAARTLLWAWNPALLLILVADGHNDGWMLCWLLLGTFLIWRGRSAQKRDALFLAGLVVMALAPLTKPVGLLALPFFYLAVLRALPERWSRLEMLASAALGTLILTVLAFLPFAGPPGSVLDLAQRLLHEAGDSAGFSFTALILLAARRLGFHLRLDDTAGVGLTFLALAALYLLWSVLRGRSPLRATAGIMGAYLVQAANFRIWYPAWLFPWLLLDEDKGASRPVVGLGFLMSSQLSVVIYGHFWQYLLGRDYLVSHAIGVPLVFLLPLGLALWQRRRSQKSQAERGA